MTWDDNTDTGLCIMCADIFNDDDGTTLACAKGHHFCHECAVVIDTRNSNNLFPRDVDGTIVSTVSWMEIKELCPVCNPHTVNYEMVHRFACARTKIQQLFNVFDSAYESIAKGFATRCINHVCDEKPSSNNKPRKKRKHLEPPTIEFDEGGNVVIL